jgi:hypothetical protein
MQLYTVYICIWKLLTCFGCYFHPSSGTHTTVSTASAICHTVTATCRYSGRTSLEDDPREGRPKSATTPEIIEQVHGMVLDDRRMRVREIAETIGLSKESVGYILHEELDMKMPCARWVPRLLTADQKRTRMNISEQCLGCFNKNKTDVLRQFITMDETWIHHYTPESKQQSKQWSEAGCSAPK